MVSRALNISRPVVTDYLQRCEIAGLDYRKVKDMSDGALESLLTRIIKVHEPPDIRYEELALRFPKIHEELKRRGVTRMLLWEEYRAENPEGYGYTQFCYHFQRWSDGNELSMHIEHKAGDKVFLDFSGEKLAITDRFTGERTPVEVFVAIFGASLLTYVEGVMSQKKEDLITACVNTLHYAGGVPRAMVPDNLKSAVTKAHRYEPDINPEYMDFARHYDTTILPARPYKPKDKALVEGAVKLVYQRIFAPLRDRVFYSLAELNAAIREALERFNDRPMKGYGKSRRELFETVEKPAL
jgi:transposase